MIYVKSSKNAKWILKGNKNLNVTRQFIWLLQLSLILIFDKYYIYDWKKLINPCVELNGVKSVHETSIKSYTSFFLKYSDSHPYESSIHARMDVYFHGLTFWFLRFTIFKCLGIGKCTIDSRPDYNLKRVLWKLTHINKTLLLLLVMHQTNLILHIH